MTYFFIVISMCFRRSNEREAQYIKYDIVRRKALLLSNIYHIWKSTIRISLSVTKIAFLTQCNGNKLNFFTEPISFNRIHDRCLRVSTPHLK